MSTEPRKKYFDLPEFVVGSVIPNIKKGRRFYLTLEENNKTLGSLGIGENYSISDADSFGLGDNSPLKAFFKEKFSDYSNKLNLQEGNNDTYKQFLKNSVIITVSADFKPWGDVSEEKWKPHARIAISVVRGEGSWKSVPLKVQERIYQIAKAMYQSGYINELKLKKPTALAMTIATEGRHILVYALPGDDTCYEIKVRPSETLDRYLNKIKK
jgi:hypothetical protein